VSERDAIDGVAEPLTAAEITRGLEQLGLPRGATVLVHSSLSALGWVAGGSQAIVVALLGVGHANNTSLHLAECRANYPGKELIKQGSPMTVDGRTQWVEYAGLDGDNSDFGALGDAFAKSGGELQTLIGMGTVRLMRQRSLVDFGVPCREDGHWTDHRAGRYSPTNLEARSSSRMPPRGRMDPPWRNVRFRKQGRSSVPMTAPGSRSGYASIGACLSTSATIEVTFGRSRDRYQRGSPRARRVVR
jgi:Aminoglycoside 3-N-acetyltransferase